MSRPPFDRFAAELDGEFVVFLIGAHINKPWAVHRWLPVALAMPRMIRELERQPELGLLGYESYGGRTSLMVQYWRSLDQLMDYARAKDSAHLPAWSAYNQKVKASGVVGIWHETYVVKPGNYENIYGNMPLFGLAKVAQQQGALKEIGRSREGARQRLQRAA